MNWQEIGVIIAAELVWFWLSMTGYAAHKLAASREKEQRRERLRRAISDFEITVNKWEKSIREHPCPTQSSLGNYIERGT